MKRFGRTYRRRCRHGQQNRDGDHARYDKSVVEVLKWMRKCGFNKNSCNLNVRYFKHTGRGLAARRYISPGEAIISVPQHLLITTSTVLSSPLGAAIASYTGQRLSPINALCCFLIYERHKCERSDWKNYLDLLPHSYSIPVYWTSEEIGLLPGFVRSEAMKQRHSVQTSFDDLMDFFEYVSKSLGSRSFSYEDYCWAWAAVNTRCVYWLRDSTPLLSDEPDNCALVPFLDLLNHSADAQIRAGYNTDKKCFEIHTLTGCSRYQQVFISYGSHSNATLLIEYGFILDANPHDAYIFSADDLLLISQKLNISDLKKKFNILKERDLLSGLSCSVEGLSYSLVSAVLIICMDVRNQQISDVVHMKKISPALRHAALTFSIVLIAHAISQLIKPIDPECSTSYHADLAVKLSSIYRQFLESALTRAQFLQDNQHESIL